jgi:hypothetical protein
MSHSRSWLLAGLLFLAGASGLPAAPLYSDHPPYAGKTRPVPVFIDAGFTDAEQQQIEGAIAEWNRALNGVARLERVATASEPRDGSRPWVIRRGAGRDGIREPGRKDQNLATAQPLPKGGGILIVFAGAADYMREHALSLRDVMMRELGHLVGLRHDTNGELLAKDYLPGDRSCVDQRTAQEVAQALAVPVEALNWCEVAR